MADRGASIRIPSTAEKDGKGYLEDRRPSSNMDPYRVNSMMVMTCCGIGGSVSSTPASPSSNLVRRASTSEGRQAPDWTQEVKVEDK